MKGTIVLLGAGASAPDPGTKTPGVPVASEMTNAMLDGAAEQSQKVQHAVRLAVSTLMFGFGVRGEDPRNGVNIEDVFNLLETLETRDSLEAAPLIGSWNPVVESLDRILTKPRARNTGAFTTRGLISGSSSNKKREAADNVVRAVKELGEKRPFAENDLRKALENLASDEDEQNSFGIRGRQPDPPPPVEPPREVPGRGVIYKSAREYLIARLKSLVWLEDVAFVSRFNPMLKAAERDRITIASLNYDNGIELAAQSMDIAVDTRLKQWLADRQLGFGEFDAVPLLKLHGSIDWALEAAGSTEGKTLPHHVVRLLEKKEEVQSPTHRPAVIFGGRNKLTVRGPFLDLLLDFRTRLNNAEQLIVVGYSFGDDHVNEYIAQWFAEKDTRRVVIVCGEHFEPRNGSFGHKLMQVGEPRVRNTKKYAREGIAELFGRP